MRVLLLILVVIVFVLVGVFWCFNSAQGMGLKQAYDQGTVSVNQVTNAGSIPHKVNIINNGSQPVNVQQGDIITSPNSQDMVVAENVTIPPNSNQTVQTYCFEPNQKAVPGNNLTPSGDRASNQVIQIIQNSNITNIQNATSSQLQIWVLVTGGKVNIAGGEASALSEVQGLTTNQFNDEINKAQNQVTTFLNITTNQLQDLANQTKVPSQSELTSWIQNFINWLREMIGI